MTIALSLPVRVQTYIRLYVRAYKVEVNMAFSSILRLTLVLLLSILMGWYSWGIYCKVMDKRIFLDLRETYEVHHISCWL